MRGVCGHICKSNSGWLRAAVVADCDCGGEMLGDICAGAVGWACGRAVLGHIVGLLAHSCVADISVGSLITSAVRQTGGSARASLVGGRGHSDRMDLSLGTRSIGRSDRIDDTGVRGGGCRVLGLVGWLIRLVGRIFGVVLGVVGLVVWVLRLVLRVFGFAIPILIVRWGVVIAVVPIVFIPVVVLLVGSANSAGGDAQKGKDGKESRVHGLGMGGYDKKYGGV